MKGTKWLLVVGIVVAVAGAGLWLQLGSELGSGARETEAGEAREARERETAEEAEAEEKKRPGTGTGTGQSGAVARDGGMEKVTLPAGGLIGEAAPEGPRDGPREQAVAARIQMILAEKLAEYPDLVDVKEIVCVPGECRVALEVFDLKLFAPAYEQMQSGEGGFAEEFGTMVLENPRPVGGGGKKAPYAVGFKLLSGQLQR